MLHLMTRFIEIDDQNERKEIIIKYELTYNIVIM